MFDEFYIKLNEVLLISTLSETDSRTKCFSITSQKFSLDHSQYKCNYFQNLPYLSSFLSPPLDFFKNRAITEKEPLMFVFEILNETPCANIINTNRINIHICAPCN